MRLVSENVRRIREAKGITKTFLAKKLGLSLQGYIHVERGAVNLSSERLRSIAGILGENVAIFFDDQLTENVIRSHNALGITAAITQPPSTKPE